MGFWGDQKEFIYMSHGIYRIRVMLPYYEVGDGYFSREEIEKLKKTMCPTNWTLVFDRSFKKDYQIRKKAAKDLMAAVRRWMDTKDDYEHDRVSEPPYKTIGEALIQAERNLEDIYWMTQGEGVE